MYKSTITAITVISIIGILGCGGKGDKINNAGNDTAATTGDSAISHHDVIDKTESVADAPATEEIEKAEAFIRENGDRFTDERDGKTYRMVAIGNQVWMAENLNFEPSCESGDSWCYDNNPANCDKYGRLYDWHTVIVVCPDGWSLPTREDWNTLVAAADGWGSAGYNLAHDWGGEKSSSQLNFSALYGGGRTGDNGEFFGGEGYDRAQWGAWWTSTEEFENTKAWFFSITDGFSRIDSGTQAKDVAFPVRCVRK